MEESIKGWVARIERGARQLEDLAELGVELGMDRSIAQVEYEGISQSLSRSLFDSQFGSIVGVSMGSRKCSGEDFWVDIVVRSRDQDLGGDVLEHLLPYVDPTSFLARLLGRAKSGDDSVRRRVALTLWYACCTTRRYVSGERRSTREVIEPARLTGAIRGALPSFTMKSDRDSLMKCLKAIGA